MKYTLHIAYESPAKWNLCAIFKFALFFYVACTSLYLINPANDYDIPVYVVGFIRYARCFAVFYHTVVIHVISSLHWRHNERDGVSNHQRFDCMLNCLFRCWSK